MVGFYAQEFILLSAYAYWHTTKNSNNNTLLIQRKKIPTKKGSQYLSQQPLLNKGISHKPCVSRAKLPDICTELPAYTVSLLSESALIKELLESYLTIIPINIFID